MKIQNLQPGVLLQEPIKAPAPLLPLALGILAGIILDHFIAIPTWISVLVVSLSATSLPFIHSKLGTVRAGTIAICLAGAAVGMRRHATADRHLANDHIVFYTDHQPILTTVRGRICTQPRIVEHPPDVPMAYPMPPKTRFLIEATHLTGNEGIIPVSGKVGVNIKEPHFTLTAGSTIELTGWLYRPAGPQNPGAYDWALHHRRNGILAGLACDHADGVAILIPGPATSWQNVIHRIRHRLKSYLVEDSFAEHDPAADVISAMVLGQRSAVSDAMNEAFVKTGNAHFLAASGMHVGWLALIGWGVCRLFGLYYRTTAVIVACLIVSYFLLAEPRPSIMRAGIIGVLACASAFLRGKYSSVNALACAAIIILLIQPTDLFRAAFQFSFIATLGLLHFCPLVSRALGLAALGRGWVGLARMFDNTLYPLTMIQPDKGRQSTAGVLARKIGFVCCQLFALALAEWLITTPLACYHFNLFVSWGWLGSFTLFFIAAPVTCLGFITVLFRSVIPSSGIVLCPLLEWATQLMVGWVDILTHLPFPMLDGRSPSLLWVIAVYAVFWIWGYRPHWLQQWRHRFKIAATLLILFWLIAPYLTSSRNNELTVWALAIGNGTATVIELPNGKNIVFDCGTRSNYAAGPVAEAFLKHRGIRRIDTVIVSHANFDHYGGIETLARHIDIDRVIINDHFSEFAPEKSSAWYFLESLRAAGIPIEVTSGRYCLDHTGDVVIDALWPPPLSERPIHNANDTSTVLRIAYQNCTILLTGDNAELSQGSLLADDTVELQANAMLLPHHGGVVHNTGKFLDRVNPTIVVRSTAQRKAMTTNGIDRLTSDLTYLSTADIGCVKISIADGEVTAEPAMPTVHRKSTTWPTAKR